MNMTLAEFARLHGYPPPEPWQESIYNALTEGCCVFFPRRHGRLVILAAIERRRHILQNTKERMMPEDNRRKWTGELNPGDKVILCRGGRFTDARLVKVARIGHNFVQIEGGRKYSRTHLHELTGAGFSYYNDYIEQYSDARWNEILAQKSEEEKEGRRNRLRRAIVEALRPASNDTELEKLEQVAAILGIEVGKDGD